MDGIVELYIAFKARKIYGAMMVMHHVISLYVLSYLQVVPVVNNLYYSFCLVEVSNYPIYLVYHLKSKKYNNQLVLKGLICCEIVSFLILRLWLGGHNAYLAYFDPNVPMIVFIGINSILVMSVIWIYGMFTQLLYKPKLKTTTDTDPKNM